MGKVISVILSTLIINIAELLVSLSILIGNVIVGSTTKLFVGGANIFQTFVNFLPFPQGTIETLDSFLPDLVWSLVTLLFVVNIVKQIYKSMNGDRTENPLGMVIKVVVTGLMLFFLFGVNLNSLHFDGALSFIGQIFNSFLGFISSLIPAETINWESVFAPDISWNLGIAAATLVLSASLVTLVLKAGWSYLGKIINYAIYLLIGPVAVSFFVTKDTEEIATNWIKNLFSQFFSLAISLLLWVLLLMQINIAFEKGGIAIFDEARLFKLAVAVALAGGMAFPEKILSYLGIKMPSGADSALTGMAVAGATASAVSLVKQGVMRTLGFAAKGFNGNTITPGINDTEMAAQGGRGAGMFDESGTALGGMAAGSSAADSQPNIQADTSQKEGTPYSKGPSEVNKWLNTGVSHVENGKVVPNGGTNNLQMVNSSDNNIVNASTNTVDGTKANGLVGMGIYNNPNLSSAHTPTPKPVFVPTNYNGASQRQIAPGTEVNAGDNKYVVSDKSYAIDGQYGIRAYELEPVDSNNTANPKTENTLSPAENDVNTNTGVEGSGITEEMENNTAEQQFIQPNGINDFNPTDVELPQTEQNIDVDVLNQSFALDEDIEANIIDEKITENQDFDNPRGIKEERTYQNTDIVSD